MRRHSRCLKTALLTSTAARAKKAVQCSASESAQCANANRHNAHTHTETQAAIMAASLSSISASTFIGTVPQGLPALRSSGRSSSSFSLQVVASKKVNVKEPLGPSGEAKWRKGVDASGRVPKGKGVYQFVKKYGANVDGYSPIYAREEWSETGDSYAGGVPGLAIWATLLGSLLVGGAFLVYSTSALAS